MEIRPKIKVDTGEDPAMCFGCGHLNPIGLKLKFSWDGETARAEFTPADVHQGWPGVVHGGIISCLLDEALNYPPYFLNCYCLTAEMKVRLRRSRSIRTQRGFDGASRHICMAERQRRRLRAALTARV